MYETKYHKASSLDNATSTLSGADDGKFLSGGMTLIPTMKQRLAAPSDLVDIGGLSELQGISSDGSTLTIGAGVTHAEVAGSSDVQSAIPALAAMAGHIGDPHVRNRGTLGGSIANNDPAADYPAAVLALGATVKTNSREISAEDFFNGMFETSLNDDEIIVSVSFPIPAKAGYAKFPNPASRYAMAGVFAASTSDGARVAVTGAGQDGVYRENAMEAALGSNWSAASASGVDVSADDLMSDIHGSSDYRANLVKVMAGRAVEAAG